MKVKIIDRCWYGNKFYDPEIMPDDELIIDYPEKNLPSWAEELDEKPAKKPADEGKGKDKGNDKDGKNDSADNRKVNDLPVVEKNALLEEAKAVGIEGNQILSWKVDTLKAKIAAKKPADEGNDGDDKGDE